MPIYEYKCEACDCDFEILTTRSEENNIICPECGISDVKRQLSVSCVGGSEPINCASRGSGGFS